MSYPVKEVYLKSDSLTPTTLHESKHLPPFFATGLDSLILYSKSSATKCVMFPSTCTVPSKFKGPNGLQLGMFRSHGNVTGL